MCYYKSLIETSGKQKGSNYTPGPSLLTTLCTILTPDKLEPLLKQFKDMQLAHKPPPKNFKVDLVHTPNLKLELKVQSDSLITKKGSQTPHTLQSVVHSGKAELTIKPREGKNKKMLGIDESVKSAI